MLCDGSMKLGHFIVTSTTSCFWYRKGCEEECPEKKSHGQLLILEDTLLSSPWPCYRKEEKSKKVNVPSDMLEYWIVLQRCIQCCLLLPKLIPYILHFISYAFSRLQPPKKL